MNLFEKNFNPEKAPLKNQERQIPSDQKETELRESKNYRQELGKRLKKIKDAGGTGSQVIKKINDVEEKIGSLS